MSDLTQVMLVLIGAPGSIVLGVVIAILVGRRKEKTKMSQKTNNSD